MFDDSEFGLPPTNSAVARTWRHLINKKIRQLDAEAERIRTGGRNGITIKRLSSAVGGIIDQLEDNEWADLLAGAPPNGDVEDAACELRRLADKGYSVIVTYAHFADKARGQAYRLAIQMAEDHKDRVSAMLEQALVVPRPSHDPVFSLGHLATTPPHWVGGELLRKPYVDTMAQMIRDGKAKSRNDAARLISVTCWKDIKAASVEAAIKRLTETYNKLYQDNGTPV